MTPERFRRAKEAFQAALERPPEERASYLTEACAGDAELLSEVESLLSSAATGDGLLDSAQLPTLPPPEAFEEPEAGTPAAPRRIGPYTVLKEIGRGGMGSVFLAERSDREYRGQVALKLVKRGMDTDFILQRFRAERQILASLNHPNIARLLDGGTTDDDLPYFVMEYIDGQYLTEYCDARHLGVRERIELFRTICAAVQFAHKSLVVHRDIKPSNLLVTPDGVPKLLDFGLAKVLDPAKSGESFYQTVAGVGIFTPEYASPEQVRTEPVTTATDVYSLGVVLYELLSGVHPYRRPGTGPAELIHAILEVQPAPPSLAATFAAGDPWKRRSGELEGDLDTIVLMALRKEPERRYATVEQLSDDLRRHLEGLPVSARADTLVYRAGKFVRRHKIGVAASLLVLLSLAAGLGVSLWQARIARRNAAVAERRFADLRSLANVLIVDLNRELERLPGATPARAALVKRAVEYLDRLAADSRGDVGLARDLAAGYEQLADVQGGANVSLGDRAGAIASLRKALVLRESVAASPSATTEDRLALAMTLGGFASHEPNSAESLALSRRAVAIGEAAISEKPADPKVRRRLGILYSDLAFALSGQGDYLGALEPRRRMVDLFDALAAETPSDANALRNAALGHKYLAGLHQQLKELDKAERHYRTAVSLDERQVALEPASHLAQLDLAFSLNGLASILLARLDFPAALEVSRRSASLSAEIAKADAGNTVALTAAVRAERRTAIILREMGRLAEAEAGFRSLVGRLEALVARDTAPRTFTILLAEVYEDLGIVLLVGSESASDPARRDALRTGARNAFRRSITIWEPIEAGGSLTAHERDTLARVRKRQQELDGGSRSAATGRPADSR